MALLSELYGNLYNFVKAHTLRTDHLKMRGRARMEAYKTTCPDCGNVRFWVGYKTGIGKTPEQLREMRTNMTVCMRCGSDKAQTDADCETEIGQMFNAMDNSCVQIIGDIITQRTGSMLKALHRVEEKLPELLRDEHEWHTLLVDYERPIVERVW